MLQIRRAHERGHANHGWLDTWHTFSFSGYYDPEHMGFRTLRVINDDKIRAGVGFPSHPHRDMEIITYVLSGSLKHQDSMGNGSTILPGDVQRMSAGSGITHSEFNASQTEELHLLQIWILPDKNNYQPSYEQKHFSAQARQRTLCLVASPTGEQNSVSLHQDVYLYAGLLNSEQPVQYILQEKRYAWLHVAKGEVTIAEKQFATGDAIAFQGPQAIDIQGTNAEVLLFNLN